MDKIFQYLPDINLGYYKNIDKIYVLGDIHGDLNKFLSFLKSINIIKSFKYPKDYNAYNRSFNQITNDVNEYITFNNNYLAKLKNICIIQLGDITDGHLSCSRFGHDYINNDIGIYAVIDTIIKKFKKLKNNCHFVLIIGNHDIENIFNIIGYDNKSKYVYCSDDNLVDDNMLYNSWGNYSLNSNEVLITNKSKKEKLTLNKLQKRNEYLTNHFDIFHNIYFIVQINDKVFSHTVLYKYVLDKLEKHIQYINNYNIIDCLNAMLKYCMMKLTKKVLTSKKEIEDLLDDSFIIQQLFNMVSTRSKDDLSLINEDDMIYFNDVHHYFVGHEVQDEINKIKHSMFDLYIYYIDIGISKSLYNINTKTKYYYVIINELNNKLQKCNDIKCVSI